MSGNESKIYDYFSENLISWQKNFGRHDLPWQKNISPYRVWISEIMLQQTQVKTVLPYFERFMEKYPTLKDLSKSDLDDFLKIWTGLGFYRRAEYIHKTSKIIKEKVLPSYQLLLLHLHEIKPLSNINHGVWSLPDGDNYYSLRLRVMTTSNYSSEQIHNIGLNH